MTSPFSDAAGPVAGAAWHVGEDLLTGYATGMIEPVAVWSVEAHLTGCARCRSVLSAQVDPQRLARNRSVLLVRAAVGDGGRMRRVLCRCGVPDHVLGLVAATPSLRRSWLLSVVGVLAVVAGEAAAVRYGWIAASGSGRLAGYRDPEVLAPFLLVAPCLCWRESRRRSCRCSIPLTGWRLRPPSPDLPCCWPAPSRRWPPRWCRWPAPRSSCRAQGRCRSRCCCRRWRCARSRSRPRPSWTPAAPPSRRGVVGPAGAPAGGESRSAADRAAERPVRVRRRAVRLCGGGAGAP